VLQCACSEIAVNVEASSRGGGDLGSEVDPAHEWLGQINRVLSVIYNQVVSLRKRSVIELFGLGVRNGSYWGIASNIANYKLANALVCPFDVTTKLAQTATRLTALENPLQEQLIDWGYAVCDAGMRRWVVPDAPAPAQSPYGAFKKP
jgi:NTE family protein